jgi:predicted phosphate transport protein (TIGR00153 family)
VVQSRRPDATTVSRRPDAEEGTALKADSIIKWFVPKEERFHELLARDTQNLVHAARLFREIAVSTSLEDRRVKVVQLKAVEHEGDQVTRDVFEALNSTFITPIDREDIRSLVSDLDDIVDHLEGVAQYLMLFELTESPEALRQFAGIIVSMAEEIDRATGLIWDMANERKVHAGIVHISELENQGDALYNTVIADLFKSSRHPTEIMKWKVVYDGLEDACDCCKDFTHALGNVLVKNA